jgi:hypothetical protein
MTTPAYAAASGETSQLRQLVRLALAQFGTRKKVLLESNR